MWLCAYSDIETNHQDRSISSPHYTRWVLCVLISVGQGCSHISPNPHRQPFSAESIHPALYLTPILGSDAGSGASGFKYWLRFLESLGLWKAQPRAQHLMRTQRNNWPIPGHAGFALRSVMKKSIVFGLSEHYSPQSPPILQERKLRLRVINNKPVRRVGVWILVLSGSPHPNSGPSLLWTSEK